MGNPFAKEIDPALRHFVLLREADEVSDKDPSKALTLFNEAVEHNPHYYVSYFRRGLFFQRILKDQQRALKDFDYILETLRPGGDDYEVVEAKAQSLDLLGEDELAVMTRSRIPKDVRERILEAQKTTEKQPATNSRFDDMKDKWDQEQSQRKRRRDYARGNRHQYLYTDEQLRARREKNERVAAMDAHRFSAGDDGYRAV